MRAVIQRVLSASVRVDGEVVGELDRPGLLVYLGVTHDDGPTEVAWTARKIWDLRLLRDEQSASDVGAPVLVVSQFTLYGDARKGRRPTWQAAAPGPVSEPLYDAVCAELERLGAHVERGRFGADMRVESVNDGPITLVLDSLSSAASWRASPPEQRRGHPRNHRRPLAPSPRRTGLSPSVVVTMRHPRPTCTSTMRRQSLHQSRERAATSRARQTFGPVSHTRAQSTSMVWGSLPSKRGSS